MRPRRPLYYLYLFWIGLFALGQRTYHVNEYLSIHPLQLLMAVIVALLAAGSKAPGRGIVSVKIRWLYFFAAFWVYGFAVGSIYEIPHSRMLEILFNFLPLLFMPYLLGGMARHEEFWRHSITSFFWVGSVIALLGTVEHWYPSALSFIPATDAAPLAEDQYGFVRAGYRFWGAPTATFIVALSLPFAVHLLTTARGFTKALVWAGASISLLGIYVGGYRSVWLLTMLLIAALLLLRYRMKGLFLSIVLLGAAYWVAPEVGKIRIATVKSVYTQNFTDSSLEKRSERARGAIETIREQPWGAGFSSAGWVHNDFLQIGVDLGAPAMVLFFAWYASRFVKLVRAVLRRRDDSLLVSLAGGFLALGGLLLFEGMTVSAWMAIPCWFVWILAETRLREMRVAGNSRSGTVPALNPLAVPHLGQYCRRGSVQ